MMCYRPGPNKGDVCDARVGCEVFGDIRPADDGLDDVRAVSTSDEGGCGYRGEVAAGPSRVLGALYYDGVAGEDGSDDGRD